MKLNCDLGESFGSWTMGLDDKAMPVIDMANIACGFHGGDPDVMMNTLRLAKQYHVTVGAHPSYPDKQGFGRRSMKCSHDEIVNFIIYQVAALDGMAKSLELNVDYVKPHGALYNDMMANKTILRSVLTAVQQLNRGRETPLKLMVLATSNWQYTQDVAAEYSVPVYFEAFADRRYTDEGFLQSRTESGSVLAEQEMLQQVERLQRTGEIVSNTGKVLNIKADTLCVHGDNEAGIAQIQQIKDLLSA